jgi:tetratricopeptide (TPR) repeat protein
MILFLLSLQRPLYAAPDPASPQEVGETEAVKTEEPVPSLEDRRAEALIQSAEILLEAGQVAEAIEAYSRAYQVNHDHGLLLEIAKASEQLGDYQQAEKSLVRYRSQAPPEQQAEVDKRIEDLRSRQTESIEAQSTSESAKKESTLQQYSTKKPSQWVDNALLGLSAASALTGTLYGLETMNIRKDMRTDFCKYSTSGQTVCASEAGAMLDKERTLSLVADVSWTVSAMSLGYSVWRSRQLGTSFIPTPNGFLLQGRY